MNDETIYSAYPDDVFVDRNGKLWRVVGICHEPTVTMQEIERTPRDVAMRLNGGVSGLMWDGFRRIYRKNEPKA